MEINDTTLQQTATQLIAAEIIKGLDATKRDEIMVKAMTNALSGYSLKSAVEKAVEDKATEVARQMVEEEQWSEKIRSKVAEGLSLYLQQLPRATATALREAMHGRVVSRSGYSDRQPGIVLEQIKFSDEKE